MSKVVEAYGQTIEFPDEMSDEDIGAAIKRSSLSIPRSEPKVGTKGPAKRGGTGGGLSNDAVAAALGPAPAAPPPTMWDTAKEGAGNLTYGVAKGLADPVYGVSQLALHGANSLSGGALQEPTNAYDTFLGELERMYQADTPGSIAAGAGRLIGNMAMPVKGAQLLKGGAAGARAVNAAGTGAVIGATQPVFAKNPDDYWLDKGLQVGVGATAGGGLSLAGSAAGGAYNAVKPLIAPQSAAGDILLKGVKRAGQDDPELGALVNDPVAMAQRLREAESLVPGSLPTTAQVAGIPQLVMAEKTLKNNPNYRVAFEDRAIANNRARLSALRGVAQTPEALEAAIAARRQLTEPLYDAANSTVHPVDEALQTILDRPSAQAALARGKKLAAEKNAELGLTSGAPAIPERQVASPVLDSSGAPFTSTLPGQAAVAPTIDGKTLQYLKMGIDDLQKEGRVAGMGSHESNALGATRNDLDSWLVSNSPAFKNANSLYAKSSVPVNTMEAGQQLLGDLSSGTLNAAGDISPALSQFRAKYAKALKDAKYGIDPEAQRTLDAIQADLQRETTSNSIKSAGSDTYFNAQSPNWLGSKLFGENLDGKSLVGKGLGALTGLLTGGPMGAAGGYVAGQKLGAFAGDRVNTALQAAMLDPKLFAKLLEEAAKRSAKKDGGLLGGSLTKAGALGSDDAVTGLLSGN